ncbi:MAG: restriction endonuclease subunit S [Ignavibacteriaceae bacterium]
MRNIESVSFDELLIDSTGGNDKILQSDYRQKGALPIIDQGENFIGGYTDDLSLKYSNQLPCIVFGDHTKILKYVDFDFALGADGTKILLTKKGFDPKFIYYYLHTFRFPANVGYSRHFKFLKEIKIPKFDLDYQIKCRNILNKADSIRKKRQQSIRLADEFLRSTFLDIFGDPVSNPYKFEECSIGDYSSLVSSGSTPLGGERVYSNEGIIFFRSQNVLMNEFDLSNVAYINNNIHNNMKRTWLKNGDVLFNITGASIGRVNVYRGKNDLANVNQHVCIIRLVDKALIPEFLSFFISFNNYQQKILSQNAGATRQAFNFEQIKSFKIFKPSIELQNKFYNIYRKLAFIRGENKSYLIESENLFNSLIQHAFGGEL